MEMGVGYPGYNTLVSKKLAGIGEILKYNGYYMDPKEQRSTGHHFFEWSLPCALLFVGKHMATYQKYPMKAIGLGQPGG